MSEYEPIPPIERNPITHARHRREVLLQVFPPLAVVIIVILAFAILATQASFIQAGMLANISLMWLITPTIIIGLLFTIILIAAIYISVVLLTKLPITFRQVHIWLLIANERIGRTGNAMVEPFIRFQSLGASIRSLGDQFRKR